MKNEPESQPATGDAARIAEGNLAEALENLEEIRTEKLAAAGFYVYATAISAARVALDRATRDQARQSERIAELERQLAEARAELDAAISRGSAECSAKQKAWDELERLRAQLAASEKDKEIRIFHDDIDAQEAAIDFLKSCVKNVPGVEIRHDNFERSDGCFSTLWEQGQLRAVASRIRNDWNRTVLTTWRIAAIDAAAAAKEAQA